MITTTYSKDIINVQQASNISMAKRSLHPSARPAQLTTQQIRAAISKLERRVSDLMAFDVDALTEDNYAAKIDDLETRIDATLATSSATTR
jgi:hypothetical protein